MMREEQGHVEPWNKIKEEDSRDEGILRRNQIKDEGANAGETLSQVGPMLAQQLVLEEIVLRSVAAEWFPNHSQDKQPPRRVLSQKSDPGSHPVLPPLPRDGGKISPSPHFRCSPVSSVARPRNGVKALSLFYWVSSCWLTHHASRLAGVST